VECSSPLLRHQDRVTVLLGDGAASRHSYNGSHVCHIEWRQHWWPWV